MLSFIVIFAAGIAALLLAQHLDIECTQPRKLAQISRTKAVVRANFDSAVSQY